jgi:hypothetical protein
MVPRGHDTGTREGTDVATTNERPAADAARIEDRARVLNAQDAEVYSLLFERLAKLAHDHGDAVRAGHLAERALGLISADEEQHCPGDWFDDVDLTELDLTDID